MISLRMMAAAGVALLAASSLPAQSLDRRIAQSDGETVQFHFTARESVCGNGRSYFRADDSGWYGNFGSGDGGGRNDVCAAGPVRIVLTRAGRDVLKIETFAGPLFVDPAGGKDLGAVPAREAAAYLLTLAQTLDGRPAREALLPAMLADSAVVTPTLAQIVRDQSRARDVRRSAISWLSRRRGEPGGLGAASVAKVLDGVVRDRGEGEGVRQQALSTIAGLDRGEGIPELLRYAADRDSWLSKQAVSTLSRSGDPRARQFVRESLKRTELSEEQRVAIIHGIGDDYATSADLRLLRDSYPALNSDRERDAVIQVVAQAGGNDNTAWLIALAKSPTETVQRRRRALSLLSRSDDPQLRDALKSLIDR
jgi:HEAT repeat protein